MPVQHRIFGRNVRMACCLPRRLVFVLTVGVTFIVILLLFSPPSISNLSSHPAFANIINTEGTKPKLTLPKISIPSIYNPFGPTAHKRPASSNETKSGDITWLNDWTWLNPFSSSVTFDENRAVLPPIVPRPYIYTFYDSKAKKKDPQRIAEDKLLLTWRRAWWAQGFRPVVLSRAETMKNPYYAKLGMLNLDEKLEADLAKWLAWDEMGTGILANYLALPMDVYDNSLLSFLRRGEYPWLTRYNNLPNSFFVGEKGAISNAVKQAFDNATLKDAKNLPDAISPNLFTDDSDASAIALYNTETISKHYQLIADKLIENAAEGLTLLSTLINSHLHTVFQNTFKKGISVLKLMPEHSTRLTEPALKIATYLTQCASSPIPNSCPPNRKCKPCLSSSPLPIMTPKVFRNMTDLYTIGTVPHPYTRMSLVSQLDFVDIRFLRRSPDRDTWLWFCTKEVLGTGVGSAPRIVRFKEMVASPTGSATSLWLTPEKDRDPMMGLEWFFGFSLPSNMTNRGESKSPVPGFKPKIQADQDGEPAAIPDERELEAESKRIQKARDTLKSKIRQQIVIKDATEAWNLADTEAWRFARAWTARRHVERLKWEEEERKVTQAGADDR